MRLHSKWTFTLGLCILWLGCDVGKDELVGVECDTPGELSACGRDDGMYNVCSHIEGRLQWSDCHAIECMPGDSKSCGELGTMSCEIEEGTPHWGQCVEGTPLVLSFDGAEPMMTEASAAASFDIGTGGACIQTDWPAAATPWLALDRDGSGSIDGGHELFGSGTVRAGGRRAAHGFEALAELDSNGDGRITAADERFEHLVLWSDHDGDKRSTHWEHEPLAGRGIVAIELRWRDEASCDARGNCGVERAAFSFVDGAGVVREGEVVDVHLPCR